jgi:eukaryotic-like serine/threonine-protein kinase
MIETNREQETLAKVVGSKYQILCRIGGGGMAQVYLARHRRSTGLFAIKVLAEHLCQDTRIVGRFEQEAKLAASLASHPNIVPIFDVGEGDGLHYLIMQFVTGEDLASFLRREGPLSPFAAANVVAQAAEALSCAEAKHIVHRDLKLANMLLDENGRVKLLDFGISKIIDVADGLTRPGETLGTPFYMSPEQIRGESSDIRSDLYSLGVVFFELLSGRRPFESESAMAIQMAHLNTPPPSLLTLNKELPAECDVLVQKLLAKRREDRYQSTAALLADLVAHGTHAGPGTLRPRVAPGIIAALQLPLEPAVVLPGTNNHASPGVPLQDIHTQTTQSDAPHAETVRSAAVPLPRTRPKALLLVAVSATVLVIAIAMVTVLLMHRKPSPALAIHEMPAVLSDAHGRMLLVAAGAFIFGGGTARPEVHKTLPSFYVDETEVSNAEYQRFCQATGHAEAQTPNHNEAPDEPVAGVSFEDAAAYAAWADKRLPTEEEWEKAARGPNGLPYPWGTTPWAEGVPSHLQPVLSEPSRRSPYGAYNMAGNVWEWTASRFDYGPAEAAQMNKLLGNSSFSPTWYTMKGGSFSPGGHNNLAAYARRGLPSDARSPWIGFRCIRDPKPSAGDSTTLSKGGT